MQAGYLDKASLRAGPCVVERYWVSGSCCDPCSPGLPLVTPCASMTKHDEWNLATPSKPQPGFQEAAHDILAPAAGDCQHFHGRDRGMKAFGSHMASRKTLSACCAHPAMERFHGIGGIGVSALFGWHRVVPGRCILGYVMVP